jgi:DNA-binding Lrp family transcriptional regulator
MAVEITDNRYGKTTKTLQDIILLILAKEHPLTMGEITKRVRKDFKVRITFQAIRKSLKTLQKRGILKEKEKKFSIKKEYILETRRYSDQLLRNYFTAERKDKLPTWSSVGEEHTTYNFENLLQTDKFWGEIVLDWARNLKEQDDRTFCFQGPHCWYSLGHLGTESDFLTELKNQGVKSYYLVENNTLLDQWAKDFYEDYDVKYLIKTKNKTKTAIGVLGEFIIQFEYPEEIYEKIERFYKKSDSFPKTRMSTIAKILKRKCEIKLQVIKNKVIASKIKKEIISNYPST